MPSWPTGYSLVLHRASSQRYKVSVFLSIQRRTSMIVENVLGFLTFLPEEMNDLTLMILSGCSRQAPNASNTDCLLLIVLLNAIKKYTVFGINATLFLGTVSMA